MAILGLSLLFVPIPAVLALSLLLYVVFFVLVVWRGFLITVGICTQASHRNTGHERGRRREPPIYSIMIPVYCEAGIMAQIARAMSKLDWPADKLDLQILLEADDEETIAAAQAADFPPNTQLTVVPGGGPRTKPNALNYGLTRARGDYVTVYDAEDLPHPDQLRAALNAFEHISMKTVCLKCPLIADNGSAS